MVTRYYAVSASYSMIYNVIPPILSPVQNTLTFYINHFSFPRPAFLICPVHIKVRPIETGPAVGLVSATWAVPQALSGIGEGGQTDRAVGGSIGRPAVFCVSPLFYPTALSPKPPPAPMTAPPPEALHWVGGATGSRRPPRPLVSGDRQPTVPRWSAAQRGLRTALSVRQARTDKTGGKGRDARGSGQG